MIICRSPAAVLRFPADGCWLLVAGGFRVDICFERLWRITIGSYHNRWKNDSKMSQKQCFLQGFAVFLSIFWSKTAFPAGNDHKRPGDEQ